MHQDGEEPIRTNERLIIAKEAARVARARQAKSKRAFKSALQFRRR
jgi:hypothetical protein